jgi:hypothetical protein
MSLAIVYTRAQVGIDAPPVSVEVHLSGGLPGLFIVGLPEAAVKESKDRVRGAILNSRFEFPSRRITINLAPADLPKEGGSFRSADRAGYPGRLGSDRPRTAGAVRMPRRTGAGRRVARRARRTAGRAGLSRRRTHPAGAGR